MIRRLGPGDVRAMPWKNGLGSTDQFLIRPEGASLATGFLLRISRAPVLADGPFSAFPGLDRSLLLLAGEGLDLDHGPHGRQRLAGPFQPVRFSGDWVTTGRLLGGPCLDFGVMTRRGACTHDLSVLRPGAGAQRLPDAPLRLVYCAEGAARVGDLALEAGAAALLEGEGEAWAEGQATLVLVLLHGRALSHPDPAADASRDLA